MRDDSKFHDTVKRFHAFKDALRKDVKNRARLTVKK